MMIKYGMDEEAEQLLGTRDDAAAGNEWPQRPGMKAYPLSEYGDWQPACARC